MGIMRPFFIGVAGFDGGGRPSVFEARAAKVNGAAHFVRYETY